MVYVICIMFFLMGYAVALVVKDCKTATGILRVIRTEDGPQMFVELSRGTMDNIHKYESIEFDVEFTSYSQE